MIQHSKASIQTKHIYIYKKHIKTRSTHTVVPLEVVMCCLAIIQLSFIFLPSSEYLIFLVWLCCLFLMIFEKKRMWKFFFSQTPFSSSLFQVNTFHFFFFKVQSLVTKSRTFNKIWNVLFARLFATMQSNFRNCYAVMIFTLN